ncbi:hypothetical protein [Streptomyces sp. NPDC057696]|uniref:hypothetical protein n=1 Tax=Streptomyces sp. NPDC057696 TaxID=3346218 RepID=UPI00367E24BC
MTGIRVRALVMHFAVAGREHELAANQVRDYADATGRLTADLRVSKVRPRIVPVPYGSRPSICPVPAWTAWTRPLGSPTRTGTPGAACTDNRAAEHQSAGGGARFAADCAAGGAGVGAGLDADQLFIFV